MTDVTEDAAKATTAAPDVTEGAGQQAQAQKRVCPPPVEKPACLAALPGAARGCGLDEPVVRDGAPCVGGEVPGGQRAARVQGAPAASSEAPDAGATVVGGGVLAEKHGTRAQEGPAAGSVVAGETCDAAEVFPAAGVAETSAPAAEAPAPTPAATAAGSSAAACAQRRSRSGLAALWDALRGRRVAGAPVETPAPDQPACSTEAPATSSAPSVSDAAPAPEPPAPAGPFVTPLPRLAGQPEDVAYALAMDGVPLPPGAGAYVVELPSSAVAPGELPATLPADPDIVAYVDAFGRVFSAGSVQAVPPARVPDVQFVRYGRAGLANVGCVEVLGGKDKAKTTRLAEYTCESGLVRVVGSRVDLGPEASKPLPLLAACAVAFLALWLFPRNAGVELDGLSVKGSLAHLRTNDLFAAIDGLLSDARRQEGHPLLVPPGVTLYMADCLRAAGLEGLRAEALAPTRDDELQSLLGEVPFLTPEMFSAEGERPADVSAATEKDPDDLDGADIPEDLAAAIAEALAELDVVGGDGEGGGADDASALHGVAVVLPDADDTSNTPAAGLPSSSDVPAALQGLPFLAGGMFGGGAALPPGVSVTHVSVPAGGDIMASIRAALEAQGITGLTFLGAGGNGPAAPSLRLVRTSSYANLFYVAFDRRQVSARGARALLEAESLLNRFAMAVEELDRVGAVQTAPWDEAARLDAWIVDRIAALADPYLDDAVRGVERADTGSVGLDVRLTFARGCEKLRLPFRLEYAFRYDDAARELVVDVECPSAALMPRLAPGRRARTYAEREQLATRYALHLTGVLAAVAFWAQGAVGRATINCWHGCGAAQGVDELVELGGGLVRGRSLHEPACVSSASFDRAAFARSLAMPELRAAFSDDPLAFLDPFDHVVELDGGEAAHLARVAPLVSLDEPRLHVQGKDMRPELDARPLTARGSQLLGGARTISDLGIYETAARTEWADGIVGALREGGRDAGLAYVKDLHDRTENLLVREACLKVSDGIEAGRYTEGSRKEIAAALSDIYGLEAGLRHAYRLLQSDPAATRSYLEAMLATAQERAWFADTPTRRYRYFDSYASRALYALRCPEAGDGRELRLASDEYYLCHYRLATLLADSLDHAEDAIAHARACVEMGPSVAAGYLRLARCYFCVFDYVSEIDVLKRLLQVAWNPTDVGMALYWLAYAFCLTDRPEAGMACYQKCVEYDHDLAEPALTEAANFLRKRGEGPRVLPDREVRRLLAREGVDLAAVERNVRFLVESAGALVDAGSFALARSLVGAAQESLRDDAVPPVLESLEE